jgi:hypothetical protein
LQLLHLQLHLLLLLLLLLLQLDLLLLLLLLLLLQLQLSLLLWLGLWLLLLLLCCWCATKAPHKLVLLQELQPHLLHLCPANTTVMKTTGLDFTVRVRWRLGLHPLHL